MIAVIQRDVLAFEHAFAQQATWDGLWRLIMGMSGERDRAVYKRIMFSQAYQQALKEGFHEGPNGYVRDLVNALRAWPVAPENIKIPVDLWYGGLDTSTVHSPDYGATLAQRLPNAWHIIDPVEGGSILWTRSGDILAKLKGHVAELIAS